MMMRSLIIIPAYNEASTIAHVVEGCSQYCDVLVIDDGSLDETLKESKEAGALVISNEINKGYECSLNVGYTYALAQNYDLMITMDADGQLPSNSIPKFINTEKKCPPRALNTFSFIAQFLHSSFSKI